MVFYVTVLNCNRFIIFRGKDDGIAGACRFAATITTPLGGASTNVMASGRDYNHPKTNGMLAQTGRLGNWVRRKIDGLSCSAAPVVRGKEKRPPHLLKNGPKAGYFDYAAFGKHKSVTRRR